MLPLPRFAPAGPPRDLSHDWRFRLTGLTGAFLLRLWGGTLRVDWLGRENLDAVAAEQGRVIWTFWHRHILSLSYTHRWRGACVLVSQHKDGEIISQILSHMGYGVVRGSTTRGGARALMAMVRTGRAGFPLAVTPDGPRGPAFELQSGILHIAQRSGLPIAPLAVDGTHMRELDSWDRFQIPRPFSRIAVAFGPLIRVPPDATSEALDLEWAPRVRAGIDATEQTVASWRAMRRGGGQQAVRTDAGMGQGSRP
jgi:lysophospholipid acyltransferase (LPLAT)-like uncharacterized protein